jgi:hypothetical protein
MDINDASDSAIFDRGGVLWLAVRNICPCEDNVGVLGLGSSFDASPQGIRGVVEISIVNRIQSAHYHRGRVRRHGRGHRDHRRSQGGFLLPFRRFPRVYDGGRRFPILRR